ncbi:hypothetical protein [Streptomyces sp. KN37]|uniref:hypothetical protein n=1 Tax=Streptomyces sp. KN37 TaxID=3090667 RepID=UPI002A75F247|nr:hypothetical protein [Streptomyces sp. KN37]WPO70372.1 hypothetical protein R9806_06910 [Streptomyces sp. KN37]
MRDFACSREADGMETATNTLLGLALPEAPHPSWDVWLLHIPGQPRFRIVYRVHHALQDGAGAAYALLALLADHPTSGPHPHRAALPTGRGWLLAGRNLLTALRPDKTWPALRATPSHRTRWVHSDVTESHLRGMALRHSVTVNDVCLAGIADALGRWHRALPDTVRSTQKLSVLVPMSFREEHELYAVGNRLTSYRLTLPCHLTDIEHSIRHIRQQTQAARTHRVRHAARPALRLLPVTLGQRMVGAVYGVTAAPIVISNITLPAMFTCLNGRLSAASLICDPVNRRLCYISFTHAAGLIRCGIVCDDALPQATTIPALWRQAVGAIASDGHTTHHRSTAAVPPLSE